MSEIYRSAVLTIIVGSDNDETVEPCIDSPLLGQPFSIFLDWSRPIIAKSLSDRLFTPSVHGLCWKSEKIGPATVFLSVVSIRSERKAYDRAKINNPNDSCLLDEGTLGSDELPDAISVQSGVENSNTQLTEANLVLEQGINHLKADKNLEALALFIRARDKASAFQVLTSRSWRIHAMASAHIALVYQMQNLPVMALDVAEASLAIQSQTSGMDCNPSLE